MEKKAELANGPSKIHHHLHQQTQQQQSQLISAQLQQHNATHTIVNSTNNNSSVNSSSRKSSETVTSPSSGGEEEELDEDEDQGVKLKSKESAEEVSTANRETLSDLLNEESLGENDSDEEEEQQQQQQEQLVNTSSEGDKINVESSSKENLADVSEKSTEETEPIIDIGIKKVI